MWLIPNIMWLDENNPVLSPIEENQLNRYLDSLLDGISACNNILDADSILNSLGQFQTDLAKAWFKYNAILPPRFKELVRKFDRSDVPFIRYSIFILIKNRQFCNNEKNI